MRQINLPEVSRLAPSDLRDAVAADICKMDYEVHPDNDAGLTMFDGTRLGSIDVLHYCGRGLRRGRRQMHHIRSDSLDDFILTLPIKAQVDIDQRGARLHLEPGSFALLATAHPFEAAIASANPREEFSAVNVRICGSQLRQRVPNIDDCCNFPVGAESGAGRIMVTLFEAALAERDALSPMQAIRLGSMLIDAVANATAEAPEFFSATAAYGSNRANLRRTIDAFINNNLSNTALNAELIAAHCHIPVRKLRDLFSVNSETLTSYIREQRLLRCREALRTPSIRSKAVFDIALKWGFNDPSYFSRAYRNRFGVSPTNDRRIDSN